MAATPPSASPSSVSKCSTCTTPLRNPHKHSFSEEGTRTGDIILVHESVHSPMNVALSGKREEGTSPTGGESKATADHPQRPGIIWLATKDLPGSHPPGTATASGPTMMCLMTSYRGVEHVHTSPEWQEENIWCIAYPFMSASPIIGRWDWRDQHGRRQDDLSFKIEHNVLAELFKTCNEKLATWNTRCSDGEYLKRCQAEYKIIPLRQIFKNPEEWKKVIAAMEAKNTSKPDGTADNHEKIPTEEPEATSVPARVPASDSEQSQTENTKSSSDGRKHSQPASAKVSAWTAERSHHARVPSMLSLSSADSVPFHRRIPSREDFPALTNIKAESASAGKTEHPVAVKPSLDSVRGGCTPSMSSMASVWLWDAHCNKVRVQDEPSLCIPEGRPICRPRAWTVPSLDDFPALPSGKESAIVVDRIESGATLEVDVNHQAASTGSHEQDRRERMHARDGMPGPSLEPDHLEHISVTGTGPTGALTASPTAVSGELTSQPTAMVSIGAMPEELPATWSCAYVNLSQQENRSADSGSGRMLRKHAETREFPMNSVCARRTIIWSSYTVEMAQTNLRLLCQSDPAGKAFTGTRGMVPHTHAVCPRPNQYSAVSHPSEPATTPVLLKPHADSSSGNISPASVANATKADIQKGQSGQSGSYIQHRLDKSHVRSELHQINSGGTRQPERSTLMPAQR
ncbi:hypothetical protein C8Q76DRAFT_689607 [Earliella scabrosa]|nr:hypothetical protein C8Q76DRAFT_689607 [Earliella scabrosa]